MSEEEILSQLRDIHFPADLAGAQSWAFAIWPFLVLGGFVLLVVILRLIGRGRWRREARAELDRITALEDADRQWTLLLGFSTSLADRSGRSITLPDTAFHRPGSVSEDDRVAFVAFLCAELAR